MPFDIEVTLDGSFSCRDAVTGQLYHNEAGAATESFKNYAEPSMRFAAICAKKEIRVLDVCFGLGYNTFALIEMLLRQYAEERNGDGEWKKHYVYVRAIELDQAIIRLLPQVLDQPYFPLLNEVLSAGSFEISKLREFGKHKLASGKIELELELVQADLREDILELAKADNSFDLVFHDPFSPQKSVELWTIDVFEKYFALMSQDSCLLTYSAASAIRGALREAGFRIYRTASLGEKKGGTAALKGHLDPQITERESEDPSAVLSNLSEAELARLEGRTSIPYSDPSFKGESKEIFSRREEEQNSKFPL